MKLALSIPDSEAHNPIKGGRDRGCKELDRDMNSQPKRLKKNGKQRREGDGEREGKRSQTNMEQRKKDNARGV